MNAYRNEKSSKSNILTEMRKRSDDDKISFDFNASEYNPSQINKEINTKGTIDENMQNLNMFTG